MRTLVTFLLLAIPSVALAQATATASAAGTITEEDFLRKVGIIAHDSMMGRDTPSPGLDQTSRWIASEFEAYGLKPAGDEGSFLQTYLIKRVETGLSESSITLGKDQVLEFGTDYGVLLGTPRAGETSGTAFLLTGSEDVRPVLEEMDVRGQLLVVAHPSSGRYGLPTRLLGPIIRARPAQVLVVSTRTDGEWAEWMGEQPPDPVSSSPFEVEMAGGGTLIFEARPGPMASVLSDHGLDLEDLLSQAGAQAQVRALPDLEWTMTVPTRVAGALPAPNVVGIIEGTDLKDEYVVFSAHSDHVGVRSRPTGGDTIMNGADDNASGTVGVVELAEAFAALEVPPRRSIIFLAVSGEEKGLWGSRYFAENSPVPLDQIVADVNMDMIGRNWPDTIVAIGKEHSDLGETLDRVQAAHPELGMAAIDDLWPEQNFYGRSDHFNFARRGVPILFFFNGTHEDYHGLDDEVEKLDGNKASRIVKLLFYLGMEIANADERPQWDPESRRQIVGGGL